MDTYEKKYKEAMKACKELSDTFDNETLTEELEKIFPELKESEDEKIRKSIIGFLVTISSLKDGKTVSNEDFDSKAILDWVAWLEKQGEQKPNYCHHEVDLSNCSEEYTKGYYDGWNNCNQQHAQLEAEQKPAEVRTTGYWYVEDTEQNPAWSKEANDKIYQILAIIDDYRRFYTIKPSLRKALLKDLDNIEAWLKSLKNRYTWKPSDGV